MKARALMLSFCLMAPCPVTRAADGPGNAGSGTASVSTPEAARPPVPIEHSVQGALDTMKSWDHWSRHRRVLVSGIPLGDWIWDETTYAQQTCRLVRTFEVPAGAGIRSARAVLTVDNGFTFYFDGKRMGRGSEWRNLREYDLTGAIIPGRRHTIAIEGFNDFYVAGLLFGLRVETTDGRAIDILSDGQWKVGSDQTGAGWEQPGFDTGKWRNAHIAGAFGTGPWSRIVDIQVVSEKVPVFVTKKLSAAEWFAISAATLLALAVGYRWFRREWARMLARERRRIARDIHDELGAGLTQISLMGEIAQRESMSLPEVRKQVNRLAQKSRDLISTVDELVWTINPRNDTLASLAAYVCQHTQNFLNGSRIRCRLDVSPDLPLISVPLHTRHNLFLAVKEALNNAARHSDATEAKVSVKFADPALIISIEDNGRGFEPAQVSGDRNGLANMQERLGEAGGGCKILAVPGRGCRVIFTVPNIRTQQRFAPEIGSSFGRWAFAQGTVSRRNQGRTGGRTITGTALRRSPLE